MTKIEKKCWPEEFQSILDGNKTFDARMNDFEVNEGDILLLREWDPKTKDYTGREIEKKVGFVGKWKNEDLTKWWSIEEIENKGMVIISLKDL